MNAPTATPTTSAPPQTLVAFRLGRQTFALPIEPIVQIIPIVTITSLPHTDPRVAGVINVRGALIPVINLHYLLNLPRPSLQLYTPIVLVRCHAHTLGLIVDSVIEVFTPPAADFASPKDILPEELEAPSLLAGMVQHTSGTVFVLDVDQLLLPNQADALQLAATALLQETEEEAAGPAAAEGLVEQPVAELPPVSQDNPSEALQTAAPPVIDAPAQKTASPKKAGAARKRHV